VNRPDVVGAGGVGGALTEGLFVHFQAAVEVGCHAVAFFIVLEVAVGYAVRYALLLEAYDHLFPAEGERYLLFDEIQYADSWELWMKVIYDMRKDIKIVATGSASPILERGSADSGVGRWRVLRVPPLSFYEYCGAVVRDYKESDGLRPEQP